jgi:hypothetical protein
MDPQNLIRNLRHVQGSDGRPIPAQEMPIGPGVAPPSHGMPSLHMTRRGSGSGLDSSRQLPPLPHFPPVQHFDPSHGHMLSHSQPHSHLVSNPHLHALPGSSYEHGHPNSSSSRSHAHMGPNQMYISAHGQYPSDGLPPVQHVIENPSISADRDRSRHDIHEHSGHHIDHHISRHSDSLSQRTSHGQQIDMRPSSRIHTHQRIGPVDYIGRNDDQNEREYDRDREREWDRSHEMGRDRGRNYTRSPSPSIAHRSHPVDRRGDYQDLPHPSRMHDPGFSGYSRSGTPASASGSGSGQGAGEGHPQSYFDPNRRNTRLGDQQHEDAYDTVMHEDGRSHPQDRSRVGGGGSTLLEHRRPSLESRKRSRGGMDVDGENELAEATSAEGGDAGPHPGEDRGSKRFHPDNLSSTNINQAVDNRKDVEY